MPGRLCRRADVNHKLSRVVSGNLAPLALGAVELRGTPAHFFDEGEPGRGFLEPELVAGGDLLESLGHVKGRGGLDRDAHDRVRKGMITLVA